MSATLEQTRPSGLDSRAGCPVKAPGIGMGYFGIYRVKFDQHTTPEVSWHQDGKVLKLTLLPWTEASPRLRIWSRAKLCLALAALSVNLGLWLTAVPLQASGGGITVVDDHHEVGFPDAINFTLTAQGEADIVNVQLVYRIAGTEIWSYAFPAFSPGRNIAASLTFTTGESNYLPPGSELEYYYVISDAAGNVHRTPPTVMEYLDDRFQWDRSQVGPLLLLHHDIPPPKVASLTREIEVALGHISSLLRVGRERPIRGIIYNSDAEAMPALPPPDRTIDQSQIFLGFAFPNNRLFVGLGFETTIIVHEAAHLLLDQALEPDALPLPAWLNEGFADYWMPPDWIRHSGRSLSSQALPLSAMSRVAGTPQEIATFYQKAESVVAFLIEEHGVDSFQRLLRRLSQGIPMEDALVQTYGFGISEVDARWSVDERWPPALSLGDSTGSPAWGDFRAVLIGTLAFVVILFVADGKIRARG